MLEAFKYVIFKLWFLNIAFISIYIFSIYKAYNDNDIEKLDLLYSRIWALPLYIVLFMIFYLILKKYGGNRVT